MVIFWLYFICNVKTITHITTKHTELIHHDVLQPLKQTFSLTKIRNLNFTSKKPFLGIFFHFGGRGKSLAYNHLHIQGRVMDFVLNES